MKKHWYDYLWIVSLAYLCLGFFNILFAWLGLACFLIPLIIAISGGTKGYCNRYCGRGQLYSLLGGRFGLSRRRDVPAWMKSRWFRYGFLIFFLVMFYQMLFTTALVFSGAQDLHVLPQRHADSGIFRQPLRQRPGQLHIQLVQTADHGRGEGIGVDGRADGLPQ